MEHKMLEGYNDVLTIEELMEILHIGKNTAYGLLQDGHIKSIRIAKKYRIPKQCVIDFLSKLAG